MQYEQINIIGSFVLIYLKDLSISDLRIEFYVTRYPFSQFPRSGIARPGLDQSTRGNHMFDMFLLIRSWGNCQTRVLLDSYTLFFQHMFLGKHVHDFPQQVPKENRNKSHNIPKSFQTNTASSSTSNKSCPPRSQQLPKLSQHPSYLS